MHDGERIKSRSQVVHHNAGALGQPLQSPNWKRLPNIEDTEENKARGTAMSVTSCPATSSMTTNCGSFKPDARATSVAAGIPMRVTAAAATIVAQARLATGIQELANAHTITVANDPH